MGNKYRHNFMLLTLLFWYFLFFYDKKLIFERFINLLQPAFGHGRSPWSITFSTIGYNLLNSFFPHFTKAWNKLENNLKSEFEIQEFKSKLKVIIKPKKQRHYNRGCKRGNSLLTQLRVGRSFLNFHGFSINLA